MLASGALIEITEGNFIYIYKLRGVSGSFGLQNIVVGIIH